MASAQDTDYVILDYEIIINCVKEVTKGSVKVTVDDLKKPESEKMRALYIGLASAIMNSSAEMIVQPELKALDDLMYPDILDDSIALINTTLILNRLLAACTIHDFNSKDIIAPKPKRTHRMLSALVNFLRFTLSRQHVPFQAAEKAKKLKTEKDTLLERRAELRRRIEAIKARKAQEYQELMEVNPIVDTLRTVNDKLKRQWENDGKVLEKIKTEVKFKSDVVNISKLEKEMQSCEEIIHDKKALLNQWSLQDIGIKQLEEDAYVALKIIKNVKMILERKREAESTLEKLKDKVVSVEQSFKDLTATLQNKRRQANSKYEKMHRLGLQHEKRMSAMCEAMQNEVMKRAQLEKDIKGDLQVRHLQLIEEEKELDELDQMQHQLHQQKINKIKLMFQQILEQLDVYHRSLTKGWQEIAPYYKLE